MAAQPYRLYSAAQLAGLRLGLEGALREWHAAWRQDGSPPWHIAWLDDAHAAGSQALLAQQRGGLLLGWDDGAGQPALRAHLPAAAAQRAFAQACGEAGAVAPGKGQTPLTQAAGQAIIEELLLALARGKAAAGDGRNAPAPAAAPAPTLDDIPCRKGNASLLLVLGQGGQELCCLMPAATARAWQPGALAGAPRRATVARKSAIGKARVRLRLEAGECRMRLADLVTLAPGDIVRLNLTLADSFSLVAAGTHLPVCKASLGQQAGHKAVQLAAG